MHNWSGQLRGLAIYNRELLVGEVSEHVANWMNREHPDFAKSQGAVVLYVFNEGDGDVAHNRVDSTTDLLIPERFFVLNKKFLERPWNEFYFGWNYWKDIGINVAGFIPLGFFFYAYFCLVRRVNHPAAVTIALGFTISFAIEVLQAFLPTRDSGMTDVITNTFGTTLGAILWVGIANHRWFARAAVKVPLLTEKTEKKLVSSLD